jgi:uncharacterized membrane protein HdeD (DUF308 family)
MTTPPLLDTDSPMNPVLAKGVEKGSKWLFWYGLLMVSAGIFAIAFPVVATLAAAMMIGWLFLFGGVARSIHAFSYEGSAFFGQLGLGALTLVVGGYLVFNPLSGAVAVTLLIASVFMVEGVFEAILALRLRPADGWGWMLFSGGISTAAGVIIASGLPGTSLFLLGLLVGVSFLSTGVASMTLSRAVKRAMESQGGAG